MREAAEAEEELAQAAPRKAYEHSDLDARERYRRAQAERPSPRLRKRCRSRSRQGGVSKGGAPQWGGGGI